MGLRAIFKQKFYDSRRNSRDATNSPGRNSYSARADKLFRPGRLCILPGQITSYSAWADYYSARADKLFRPGGIATIPPGRIR